MQSVLGFIPEVARSFVSNLAIAQAKNFTGNSPLWDATVISNKTAVGIADDMRTKNINSMADQIGRQYTDRRLRVQAETMFRTMESEDAWLRKNKYDASNPAPDGGYDRYIKNKVDSFMSSSISTTVFNQLANLTGFDDKQATAANMKDIASQVARTSLRRGNTLSYAADAKRFTENLFNPEKYDKRDYGNFGASATTRMGARLAEFNDVLQGYVAPDFGADENKTRALEQAAKAFQERVRSYMQALEPLRDVFGDDIDKMVSQLQDMTGQNIATMGSTNVSAAANRLRYELGKGLYSAETVSNVTRITAAQMAQMNPNVSPWARLGAQNVALDSLNMVRSGYQASWMTDAEWGAYVQSDMANLASSQGTDLIAKAYAIWKHKEGNGEKGFDDFRVLMNDQQRNGVDSRHAAMRLAGANTLAELEAGTRYEDYQLVLRNGDATAAAQAGVMQMQTALARSAFASSYAARGIEGVNSYKEAANRFDMVAQALSSNPTFDTMSHDERIAYLKSMKDAEGNFIYIGKDGKYDEQKLESVDQAMNVMLNTETGRNFVARSKMAKAREQEQDRKRKEEARISILNDIASTDKPFDFSSGWGEAFKNGFSLDSVKRSMRASSKYSLADIGDDAASVMAGIYKAAELVGGGAGEAPTDEQTKMMQKMAAYAASGDARTNAGWVGAVEVIGNAQKKLEEADAEIKRLEGVKNNNGGNWKYAADRDKYYEAKKQKALSESDIKRSAARMAMYTKVSSEVVDEFFNESRDLIETDDNGNAVIDEKTGKPKILKALTAESTDEEIIAYRIQQERRARSIMNKGGKGAGGLDSAVRWDNLERDVTVLEATATGGNDKRAKKDAEGIRKLHDSYKQYLKEHDKEGAILGTDFKAWYDEAEKNAKTSEEKTRLSRYADMIQENNVGVRPESGGDKKYESELLRVLTELATVMNAIKGKMTTETGG